MGEWHGMKKRSLHHMHMHTHAHTYTHRPLLQQPLQRGTEWDSLLQKLGRALRYTYGKKITHSGGRGGLYKLLATAHVWWCGVDSQSVCALRGVNPVLINDCMLCSTAVCCSADSCALLSLQLCLHLTLPLPTMCKWRDEQWEECGSEQGETQIWN